MKCLDTTKIWNIAGKIFVFLEYCEFGTLDAFLRSGRDLLQKNPKGQAIPINESNTSFDI